MDSCDIDFVLPWVDGADPAWKALYDLYSSQEEKNLLLFFDSLPSSGPSSATNHK